MNVDRRDLIRFCARWGIDHRELERGLRRAKLERELEETSEAMRVATERLNAAIGSPVTFSSLSDECDRLFRRHERLVESLYPAGPALEKRTIGGR